VIVPNRTIARYMDKLRPIALEIVGDMATNAKQEFVDYNAQRIHGQSISTDLPSETYINLNAALKDMFLATEDAAATSKDVLEEANRRLNRIVGWLDVAVVKATLVAETLGKIE